MNKQFGKSVFIAAAVIATTVPFLPTRVSAQFPAESTIPKNKRKGGRTIAKASTAPAPRTKDGKPDLSGAWGYAGYTSDIAKDYDVGELPMTPLADRLFKERQANLGVDDPEARCLPTGVPRRDPYPTKIVQSDKLVVILFEGNIHSYRQIFLDRQHPKEVSPTWYGDSVGHWDGDELVVDTIGFNGLTWLDMAGHGSSDQLHVIERYSRPDFGHLKNVITIEDPVYYTRPWNVTEITPMLEGDMIEYICQENERDVKHFLGTKEKLEQQQKK
jgi:hypothetical protein